jgi:hypothetical protein
MISAVLLRTIAEPAAGGDVVGVVEVHNLDIAVLVLAEGHLEVALALEDLACAAGDHVVDALGDHYGDCR